MKKFKKLNKKLLLLFLTVIFLIFCKSVTKKEFESEYFLSLFNENKVSLLHMTTDFKDEKNNKKSF